MVIGKYAVAGFLLLVSLLAATQTVQSQQYSTTTSQQVTPIFSGPATIPGTHGVCGEYFFQPFTGTAGEVLIGSVTASGAVDVYLMTSTEYQAWQHQVVAGGDCTPASLVASRKSTTSYTLSTTIPATGTYDLVVNNLSEKTVTAQITASLTSAAPSPATAIT
jgi:hypothetical protein